MALDLAHWDKDISIFVVENKDTMVVWFLNGGNDDGTAVRPEAA